MQELRSCIRYWIHYLYMCLYPEAVCALISSVSKMLLVSLMLTLNSWNTSSLFEGDPQASQVIQEHHKDVTMLGTGPSLGKVSLHKSWNIDLFIFNAFLAFFSLQNSGQLVGLTVMTPSELDSNQLSWNRLKDFWKSKPLQQNGFIFSISHRC